LWRCKKKNQVETTNWKQGDTGHWVLGVVTSLYVRGYVTRATKKGTNLLSFLNNYLTHRWCLIMLGQ
jgi:hypothetical protein